jgi:Bifunctional DNA primase/polymerase, N-terminal
MSNPILDQALACADRGWPVFPCQSDRKTPATRHSYLDATTDPAQITEWFARRPELNLAVATGAPGPDILDIDHRGEAGHGFGALGELRAAGLLDGIVASVRTPSAGLHLYLTGSRQRSGHLPACHVDFLAQGGYALVPPSEVDGRPYAQLRALGGDRGLDWAAARRVLEPSRESGHPTLRQPAPWHTRQEQSDALARWVAAQPEGNRNAGLFWAANRALETDHAADLSPLAAAARRAGLTDPEITRTLNSARRTRQARPESPDRQAEGEH